jgi:hypothetical protein
MIVSAMVIMLTILGLNMSLAGMPEYKISVENIKLASSNAYEFEIYLHHTKLR